MLYGSYPNGHVICTIFGVHLVRYGPPGRRETKYDVVEPDHVAAFSRPAFPHPLSAALNFLLDRAYSQEISARPSPTILPEDQS